VFFRYTSFDGIDPEWRDDEFVQYYLERKGLRSPRRDAAAESGTETVTPSEQ